MNLSIVIPAYNEEKYIATCLESIVQNGNSVAEIIVVDNNSTDRTAAVAALATVVGVLVEVPVMLSVCNMCNRTRHWFAEK